MSSASHHYTHYLKMRDNFSNKIKIFTPRHYFWQMIVWVLLIKNRDCGLRLFLIWRLWAEFSHISTLSMYIQSTVSTAFQSNCDKKNFQANSNRKSVSGASHHYTQHLEMTKSKFLLPAKISDKWLCRFYWSRIDCGRLPQ